MSKLYYLFPEASFYHIIKGDNDVFKAIFFWDVYTFNCNVSQYVLIAFVETRQHSANSASLLLWHLPSNDGQYSQPRRPFLPL